MVVLGRKALNRRIEPADLTIEDRTVEDGGVAQWVACSKTDQDAHGEDTWVPSTGGEGLYDLVQATRDWLNCLHRLGVDSGVPRPGAEPGGEPLAQGEREAAHCGAAVSTPQRAAAGDWAAYAAEVSRRNST